MRSRRAESIADQAPDSAEAVERDERPASVLSMQILETLAKANAECGVTWLAQQVGVPKARLHRHIAVLREHGFVSQNPQSSRYGIGWRLYVLGQQVVKQFGLGTAARPVMEELLDSIDQTIVVSTFTRDEIVVLDFLLGRNAVSLQLRPGSRFALNSVAQGKVVLAFGPPAYRERLLSRDLSAATAHTITDPVRLNQEIEQTLRRGWADAPEEVISGVNAIAVPIFAADGALAGTLASVGAIHFMSRPPPADMVQALLRGAREISRALGFDGTMPAVS